jgi:hypothetical protein
VWSWRPRLPPSHLVSQPYPIEGDFSRTGSNGVYQLKPLETVVIAIPHFLCDFAIELVLKLAGREGLAVVATQVHEVKALIFAEWISTAQRQDTRCLQHDFLRKPTAYLF